ncbi:MAG: hypothetical protein RL021_2186 [Bacteroidota bacterium]|jgi:ligand-binding SRPBCC domain-containing protein
MSLHSFHAEHLLPVSLTEAWDFFSSPRNLSVITPPEMDFRIITKPLEERTYAGQIIAYKVSPLPFMRTTWVTEITHVREPEFFVDEQRMGPYALWHHQHRFEQVEGGVRMTDTVHYRVPFGWLGDLLNILFIRKRIEAIFRYRRTKLEQLFPKEKPTKKPS